MMANAALAMEHFYSHLFTVSPETRANVSDGHEPDRERVFAALARLVWSMDGLRSSRPIWRNSAAIIRKYGVKDQHYHTFLRTLLDTRPYFGRATGPWKQPPPGRARSRMQRA